MDRWGALKIFVRTAETRSFVAAGRHLGLSASAVGKAVARLEERLGARLFHRSTHSLALTPDGARFLERCRRILAEMETAEQELSQAGAVVRGPLKVSVPSWATMLLPAFGEFIRRYPEARLELEFSDRLADVIEEGFDLVVRTGALRDSRLLSRGLGRFRHAVVAAPAYLARHGTPEVPDDLLRHACLHRRHPESGKIEPWPLARDAEDAGSELPVTAVADAVEARVQLAERGVGIACVPSLAVGAQLADGRLVPLLENAVRDVGTLHMVWPESRSPSGAIKALVGLLAEERAPPLLHARA